MPTDNDKQEARPTSWTLSRIGIVALLYLVAAAGGYAAYRLSVPLPWMIGPLIAVIPLALALEPPAPPRQLRMTGQVILGTAIGLYLSPQALEQVLLHWLPLILAAVATIVASILIAILLTRNGRVNRSTALFATIPGGPVEMARLAEATGGEPTSVALAQGLRIVAVILIFPPLAYLFDGGAIHTLAPPALDVVWPGLVLLFALATGAGLMLRMVKGPNPFFLGPLALSAALTATGLNPSDMPPPLLSAGQLCLAVSLGSMFRRDRFHGQKPFLAFVVWSTLLLLASSVLMAVACAGGFGIPFIAALLATAPGSVAEMAITAQALELAVPLVTSFHVGRIFLIMVTAPLAYRLMTRFARPTPARTST